jgi:hypothetical protein
MKSRSPEVLNIDADGYMTVSYASTAFSLFGNPNGPGVPRLIVGESENAKNCDFWWILEEVKTG